MYPTVGLSHSKGFSEHLMKATTVCQRLPKDHKAEGGLGAPSLLLDSHLMPTTRPEVEAIP